MNVEEKEIGKLLLLRLSGTFTTSDVSDLHLVFEQASASGKRIVLEFNFAKTPSYSILVPILKLAGTVYAKSERLNVARASGNLRFLLTMLNKQDWFEFYEAINELVIEESNSQSTSSSLNVDEMLKQTSMLNHIPNVTDFDQD